MNATLLRSALATAALSLAGLAAQDPTKPVQPASPAPAPATTPPQDVPAGMPEDREEFNFNAASAESPYVELWGIVARDPRTGDLGVLAMSSAPGFGSYAIDGRADLGIAVVGGNTDPTWAQAAIEQLAKGLTPADAVTQLKAATTHSRREYQHLVVMSADGKFASHVGEFVFGAGTTTDTVVQPDWAVFTTYPASQMAQTNLKTAYPTTEGLPLPERLIAAMQQAKDSITPDVKGVRKDLTNKSVAAVLLVLRKEGGRNGRSDRMIDLRVDFDTDPLGRLRGLYRVWSQAQLGPSLRASTQNIKDPKSPAYQANQEWMKRLRSRAKIGEKR